MTQTSEKELSIVNLEAPVLALPLLPSEKAKTHMVQGNRKDPYEVNLNGFSCTCPDWLEQRARFEFPDIRRVCKHIFDLIPSDLFVLQGNKLAGWLVPIPSSRYRLGAFEVEGYAVLFRQAEDRHWIDVVTASRTGEGASCYDVFGLEPDERRWANGETPRNPKIIKKLIRDWIKSNVQPWQGEMPPLPISAIEAQQKRLAQEEVERRQRDEERTRCYACNLKLEFPSAPPETVEIICPCCGITNVQLRSGTINRPERMAIYRKYDGDLYSKRRDGLIPRAEEQLDAEFEMVRQLKEAGRITEKEYKSIHKEHNQHKQKILDELSGQKRAELERLLKQEKEIQKKFCKE